MTNLTQDLLRELLNYNPDSGVFTNKINRGSVKKGAIAGSLNKDRYIQIKINRKQYKAHRLAWLFTYGEWPANQIDHINHIRDDNRIDNLREVTHSENHHNRSKSVNNTSGYTGIHWNKPASKWQALISIDGKRKHLGLFEDINEAIAVRAYAERSLGYHENHGE